MTKFTLIRHSITDWNTEGRWQGHSDTPLNETGILMAKEFAEGFDPKDISLIYSSDLSRAVVTAGIIAEKHLIEHRQDPRIRELRLGIWEGMLVNDIKIKHAADLELRQSDPEKFAPQDGETLAELKDRIIPFFTEAAKAFPDLHICVVSHSVVIRTMLALTQGLPLSEVMKITCEHLKPYEIIFKIQA